MEITVAMTAEDFMAFMEWKRDKKVYERRVQEVIKNMEHLASSVLKTLEECGETDEPEYKIGSQEDAAKLVVAATDVFE